MISELHAFYFDEEKKKYFTIKGLIPGSKPSSSSSSKAAERKPESEPFKASYLLCKKLESWQIVCIINQFLFSLGT